MIEGTCDKIQCVTVREHFQLVLKRLKYFITAAAIGLVLLSIWLFPEQTRLHSVVATLLVAIILIPLILVAVRGRFRCPRCGTDLARLRRQELLVVRENALAAIFNVDLRVFSEAWDECPNCHVNFDEPYP